MAALDPATAGSNAQAIVSAANKYAVPVDILLGVFGKESTFGANHSTSSAGAVGPFQFMPGTAKTYGYPLTNTPNAAQFQAQADAAAAKLAHDAGPSKDWAAAITTYGGGYTLADVQAEAKKAPQVLSQAINILSGAPGSGPVQSAVGAVSSTVDAAQSVGQSVGQIASLVTSGSFWLRIGGAIAGALLIFLGLHALVGQSSSLGGQPVVKHVTRIIPI